LKENLQRVWTAGGKKKRAIERMPTEKRKDVKRERREREKIIRKERK